MLKHKFWLKRFLWLAVISLLLTGCDVTAPSTSVVSIGVGGVSLQSSMATQNRAAISDAYPSIGTLLLSVSTRGLTVADINRLYNNNKFQLNAQGNAIVLTSTVVDLVVPNGADITLTIIALNKQNVQVFKGETVVTTEQLAQPSVAVAVPMQVSVDTTLPIAAGTQCSERGGNDSDEDGLCSVFEDIFTNAAGTADINGNELLNSADNDSDGDGIPDKYDNAEFLLAFYNDTSVIESYSGGEVTYSNRGYPMFTVANKAPIIDDVVTVTVQQGVVFEWALDSKEAGLIEGDQLIFEVLSSVVDISVEVSDNAITIDPGVHFVGTESIMVTAHTLGSWFLLLNESEQGANVPSLEKSFTLSVIVEDNPAVNAPPVYNGPTEYQSTAGAHVLLDILSHVTDVDGDAVTLLSASIAEVDFPAEAQLTAKNQTVRVLSERNASDAATVKVDFIDSEGASGSATISVFMNADADGDGLSGLVASNEAATTDSNDNDDGAGDSFSDWHTEFNGGNQVGTAISGDINVDTRWGIAGSPYILSGAVTVSGTASLIVEQGVVVQFEDGASLTINDSATITALGGASHALAVVFTSVNDPVFQSAGAGAETGSWVGVTINSNAGSYFNNSAFYYAVNNLTINGGGQHVLKNSILSSASKSGLILNSTGDVKFFGNQLTHNKQGLLVHNVGPSQVFDYAMFAFNRGGDTNGNGAGISVWSDIGGTFRVTNSLIVGNEAFASGGALWLEGGVPTELLGLSIIDNTATETITDDSENTRYTAGIFWNATAGDSSLLVKDTVFNNNDGCVAVVCFSDITVPAAAQDSASLNSESKYNYTDYSAFDPATQGQFDSLLGSDASNTIDPEDSFLFSTDWYADHIEGAGLTIDANTGVLGFGSFPSYLTALGDAYSTTEAVSDGKQVSIDALDIGFHHREPKANVDAIAISEDPVTIPFNRETTLQFYPRVGADNQINPFYRFGFTLNSLNSAVGERYLPGSRFSVTLQNNLACDANLPQPFTNTVDVNGDAFTVFTVTVETEPCPAG